MLPSIALILAFAGASPDGVFLQADGSPSAAAAAPEARSLIDLFVFDSGTPLFGIEMRVGSETFGTTDSTGGLSAQIPSGRQRLALYRDGQQVVDLDLLTDKGELVQILVTLQAGEPPAIDIENSGRSSVLAGERLKSQGDQPEQPVAQDQPPGALVGTIVSAEDQKPVVDARIFFSGSPVETKTDDEGKFAVELPAGNYSLSVVHPDYATQTKDNVRVIPAREVTVTLELTPAGLQLQDYVVTAPYVEGSIASTIEQQRETSAVSEVLGAEQMAAAGDSDAAEALQRVSGLTIEQGKYVLVRGQGYRYTYTLWNGSPLPSPEPLLRVVPLDLFPTGVLSGIEVQKSYSVDRPAAFGGGLINLQTRGIPSEEFVSVTVSTGINTVSAFTQGRDYQGGSLDIFGFDDGTRAVPQEIEDATDNGRLIINNRNFPDVDERNRLAASLEPIYAVDRTTLPPDLGITVAGGGSIDIFWGGTLGAILSTKWSSKWRRQRRTQRRFNNELRLAQDIAEDRTDFNSDIGGLLTIEATWENHSLATNTFYAHQTQQRTQFDIGNQLLTSTRGITNDTELSWIDRTLIAQQVVGKHDFKYVKLDYRGIYSLGLRDSPDRRSYTYIDAEGAPEQFFALEDNGMLRRFNTVDDTVLGFGVDLTGIISDYEENWFGLQVKAGVAGTYQDREVINRQYQIQPNGADTSILDPEELYRPDQIGDTLRFRDQSDADKDDSISFIDVFGVYGMADVRLGDLLRFVGGVRWEDASAGARTFFNDPNDPDPDNIDLSRFRQEEFYPAVAGTWFIVDELQLRATYGKTTSRPNLNELSSALFIDPDSNQDFRGDPNLRPAVIDAFDGRIEWYPTPTESMTLGVFYKIYEDPIIQIQRPRSGVLDVFSFTNGRRATVFGVEFGGRFEFGHIREWLGGPEFLEDMYLLGNVAILTSNLELETVGTDLQSERRLEGQADYTFNVQAGYSGEDHDLTVAFNMVGQRLFQPAENFDIVRQSIPTLDITWTWRIWDGSTAGTLRVGASNLIDPDYQWRRGDLIWRQYKRGRTFGTSFKISFQ